MTLIRPAALLIALLAAAPSTWAHDDATLDATKAPHGGQLRMAGAYHFELVAAPAAKESKASPMIVYVTDHAGNGITTVGATGTATILSGARKTSITLSPSVPNRMSGEAAYALGPETKIIVSIALAGKTVESARFTPLARPADR